jgi:hypothetical protein
MENADKHFDELLASLEPTHAGQYLLFNTEDGTYAVAATDNEASDKYSDTYGEPPDTGWKFIANIVPLTRRAVKPGVYKHFKGNTYHVLGVSENTETHEFTVVYIPQYGEYKGKISNRSLAMFLEHVDRPELSYKGPRFTLIEERNFIIE